MHHFCAVYQDEDAIKIYAKKHAWCFCIMHKKGRKLVLFVDSTVNKEAMITLKAQRL